MTATLAVEAPPAASASMKSAATPHPFTTFITLPPDIIFDFEPFLKSDLNLDISRPTTSTSSDVCKFFTKGYCHKGASCQFRHARNEKRVVCKHWLRGLCKKGDLCEYLHEYNLKKMDECRFYAQYGECSNPECVYLHVDPETKVKDCPFYQSGFCKLGPSCKGKHTRKAICQNYLTGFCPKGPECNLGHPKFDPPNYNTADDGRAQNADPAQQTNGGTAGDGNRPYRPLDQVTCFKCGDKGHYANHCPKRRKFEHEDGQPIPTVS